MPRRGSGRLAALGARGASWSRLAQPGRGHTLPGQSRRSVYGSRPVLSTPGLGQAMIALAATALRNQARSSIGSIAVGHALDLPPTHAPPVRLGLAHGWPARVPKTRSACARCLRCAANRRATVRSPTCGKKQRKWLESYNRRNQMLERIIVLPGSRMPVAATTAAIRCRLS